MEKRSLLNRHQQESKQEVITEWLEQSLWMIFNIMFIYFSGGTVTDDRNSCNDEIQQMTAEQQTMVNF